MENKQVNVCGILVVVNEGGVSIRKVRCASTRRGKRDRVARKAAQGVGRPTILPSAD